MAQERLLKILAHAGVASRRAAEALIASGHVRVREESTILRMRDVLEGSSEEVQTAINDLVVETSRTLRAYSVTEPDEAVEQVIVAGGTGVEPELAQRLESMRATWSPGTIRRTSGMLV